MQEIVTVWKSEVLETTVLSVYTTDLEKANRVEGSRMAPPLPLHRTYGSRIRRYINCKSISDFIEIVCKGVDKSRIDRDFPLAF